MKINVKLTQLSLIFGCHALLYIMVAYEGGLGGEAKKWKGI